MSISASSAYYVYTGKGSKRVPKGLLVDMEGTVFMLVGQKIEAMLVASKNIYNGMPKRVF